jgi:exosome complex component RRP43
VPSSCLSQIGDSKVICGISIEVAQPEYDYPADGFVIVNIDRSCQGCSETIEEAPLLNKLINSIVDKKLLCIKEAKYVFVLHIDLYCLVDDGCLFDCCLLASTSALKNLKLPYVTYSDESAELSVESGKYYDDRSNLLLKEPVSMSFGLFDKEQVLLADPDSFEETVCDGKMIIVVDRNTGKYLLTSKRGSRTKLTMKTISQCASILKGLAAV